MTYKESAMGKAICRLEGFELQFGDYEYTINVPLDFLDEASLAAAKINDLLAPLVAAIRVHDMRERVEQEQCKMDLLREDLRVAQARLEELTKARSEG